MNEQHQLNGEVVREWLEKDGRKQTFLSRSLRVSDSLVDKMLNGHVPKERTLKALAQLLGVEVETLLIPKAKTA